MKSFLGLNRCHLKNRFWRSPNFRFLGKFGIGLIGALTLGGLVSGCGYRFGQGELASKYETISVPYVKEDLDGTLTAQIVKALSVRGGLRYERVAGDLILYAEIIDVADENIGFRYYRNKANKITKETIPVETRLSITAEISIVDASTGEVLRGPVRLSAETDFDHDYYSTKNNINESSLGQLTDFDEAYDAAKRPLHQELAKKIVDYIYDSW